MQLKRFITILVLFTLPFGLQSQTLSGFVFNAENEALAGVNVYLPQSNAGTITNNEGFYSLRLPAQSQRIVFSYIGYKSDTLSISLFKNESRTLNLVLKEHVLNSAAIYVFAKQFNDAQEIVYKTIENKKAYLASIKNYSYDAYQKIVFKLDKEKIRFIGGIIETKSKGYFEQPDRFQEVVLAKRQSKNFSNLTNALNVGRVPNLLDETLNLDEVQVLSPLSTRALDYYAFRMIDTTFYNNQMVFNIAFKPKSGNMPLFSGTMSIVDQDFAVVACLLNGLDNVQTLIRDSIKIIQHFRQFDQKYWFPVEMQMDSRMNIDIPGMPYLYWKQHVLISNYALNRDDFNYAFDENQLRYQLVTESESVDIWQNEQTIPLEQEEKLALQHIDSVVTNASFFTKSIIWGMANFDRLLITGFYDFYHYNRVQGTYMGFGFDSRRTWRDRQIRLRVGYGFADKKYLYDLEIKKLWSKERFLTEVQLQDRLDFLDRFYRYNPSDITSQTLFRKNDYADYFYRRGGVFKLEYRFIPEFKLGLNYEQSTQKRAPNHLNWTSPKDIRPSFAVDEGTYRSLEFYLGLDDLKYFDYGWLVAPDMSQNFYDLQLRYLKSSAKYLQSAKDFERYYIYFSLFQQAPPLVSLYLRLNAGYLSGSVPLQYYFHLAGAYGSFGNPVLFRTVRSDQFLADRFLIIALENNFKNTFFRLLHLPWLSKSKLDLLLFVNVAFMHNPDVPMDHFNIIELGNKPLTEVGVSLGNLFTFFRLDFTWRLNYRTHDNFKINLTSRLFIR